LVATPQARLERIVSGLVMAGAPGALAVVRTPTRIDRAASGVASIKPRSRLRSTDRYRIASVTKTFVATVVLQLAAEGRLALTDSVERWLPGLVPNGKSITLHQLLNHTSGIFDYDEDAKWVAARFANPGREWAPRKLVAIATSHPPHFSPGNGWSYSNTNYVLLGLVVEKITRHSLGRELQARLFGPLALRATSYPAGARLGGRYAHGYLVGKPPLPVPRGSLLDVSTLLSPSAWGAGQIVSSASDVTAFFAALLKGRLLPPALLKAMKAPVAGYPTRWDSSSPTPSAGPPSATTETFPATATWSGRAPMAAGSLKSWSTSTRRCPGRSCELQPNPRSAPADDYRSVGSARLTTVMPHASPDANSSSGSTSSSQPRKCLSASSAVEP
jgi:D-alanyl-D-alanine carboxypeptidase